jgi:TatD DNase family protein
LKFINIHTHHITARADEFCIVDWFTLSPEDRNEELIFSAGIHPWKIIENEKNEFELLAKQVAKKNCVAIGESGLDKLKGASLETQITLFEKQLQLAMDMHKPVIVHCVKAYDELISIKKKYEVQLIVHGYNQSWQMANQLLQQNMMLSFGEALLNKNSKASETIKKVPLNKLFLENDAKDMPMKTIFEAASNHLQINVEDLCEQINRNYNQVFK